MRLFNHLSVKWKIYLIAIVSLIGFGGYLSFNMWVNSSNAVLLSSLQSVSFPVLEKSTANRVMLDRLSEQLNNAVLTGEQDRISDAEKSALSINTTFDEISALLPNQQERVIDLRASFNEYYDLTKKIATEMAQGTANMDTLPEEVNKKEKVLAEFKVKLDNFINYSRKSFSENINNANDNSQKLLTSGFVIWVFSILLLTFTVYTIAKIILSNITQVSDSLQNIARGGGDFSKKIEVKSNDEIGMLAKSFNALMDNLSEKTNDLVSMMSNMHQGLFTITEEEVIHKEYSAYIEKIFGTTTVAGRNYAELLFQNADIGSDIANQVTVAVSSLLDADEMMFDFNRDLLIKEYRLKQKDNNEQQIIELEWDPIIADGTIKKLMVTVRDVTELRNMQAAAESQKIELNIVGQILKASPEKFELFYKNALSLIHENTTAINANPIKNSQVVANLFVNMHTIKGNARTYNFTYIAEAVHEAENIYDRLRKEGDYPWNREQLLGDIGRVNTLLEKYRHIHSEKLSFTSSTPANAICIDKAFYNSLLIDFEKALHHQEHANLLGIFERIKSVSAIPLEKMLDELIKSLPSIASQLNKEAPKVFIKAKNISLLSEHQQLINDVFTHLFRNSLDHGIESGSERESKGKPKQGSIFIEAVSDSNELTITLRDDGRGLALQKIKARALSENLLQNEDMKNPQKIAECLFSSGISTAAQVTDISGRGVGMDAVRQYLTKNGCNILLMIDKNASADDEHAAFELTMRLPSSFYMLAQRAE